VLQGFLFSLIVIDWRKEMIRRFYLNGKEKSEAWQIIKDKTDYGIRNTSVLNQIFRRSSFAAETGKNSNEIFEFIGDQVLSYYVVKIVAERCGSLSLTDDYTFRIRENQFTLIKQALVNNETLAKIIDDWDIAKYLLLGKSDIKNEVTNETKVKADLFEAVLGAIAVESNWDSEILETAVSKALKIDETIKIMIDSDTKVRCFDIDNAITTLKEMAENGQCTMPEYEFKGPEHIGYDGDGNPKWSCSCSIINDKIGFSKIVYASSKKEAKKAAAYLILCEHLGVQNKYGPNDWFTIWSYKNGKLIPNHCPNSKEK
jgi:ribonuclease-3